MLIKRFSMKRNYQCRYLTNGHTDLKYIPKKIFQVVADKNNIHPLFLKNIDYIKKMNPDWEYTLYDDKDIIDYIRQYYSAYILYIYNKINPNYGAARADFFRYLLMYREGGVYLDLKSATEFPLNNIIQPNDEYILSTWACPQQLSVLNNKYGEYQQWHIICRPNHPFLEAVINKVIDNIENYNIEEIGAGKHAVFKITGPIAYTIAIDEIKDNFNYRLLHSDFIGLIYNNLSTIHSNLYSKKHYSKIKESVII